ncbi:FAD-binding monooxygenase [Mycolicibacterium madagascariense]|uniref:FAD-binding monooxygenase n=1 Tax=Mycolicibacterium madagascariense TaxID=212765 RepID=A0A7I7X8V3_9MYCO|nr:FAD-dependent oxidoreductase [Mycolicibacterium madagascariense]MCV7012879.1 FAD-dependent monooxygenase [Mycolicibacterium madagascariense]BBZ26126.1 FAD-binding monooxygenase [Mycolicibacterium madagascariense]
MARSVLVSGAGIAGATAAYWLQRAGCTVTVIERAPAPRDGGQNVDVRGMGRDVLRRMDLEETVRSRGTGEVGLRFVGEAGRTLAEFPAGASASGEGFTAELEILRGELARLLVESCGETVDFTYGTCIEGVAQDDAGVDVTCTDGTQRRFDLLIIAEGIRSTTRNDVFGGEPDLRDLGYYTSYCTIPRTADDQWWRWYTTTGGRAVQLRPDNVGTTRASLNFRCPPTGLDTADREAQVRALQHVFADVGDAAPRILAHLAKDASSLYLDRIAQVRMPAWSRGRIAVVGDAAYCATPVSGMGTSLALIGAYLLAEALGECDDHAAAFAAYEEKMRPIVDEAQKLPPGVPDIANPASLTGVRILRAVVRIAGYVMAVRRRWGRH